MRTNTCPVCGYGMEDPPQDFNICSCCGTEFGYNDKNASFSSLRLAWLRNGAKWWSTMNHPPMGWDAYQQLNNLLDGTKPVVISVGKSLNEQISATTNFDRDSGCDPGNGRGVTLPIPPTSATVSAHPRFSASIRGGLLAHST